MYTHVVRRCSTADDCLCFDWCWLLDKFIGDSCSRISSCLPSDNTSFILHHFTRHGRVKTNLKLVHISNSWCFLCFWSRCFLTMDIVRPRSSHNRLRLSFSFVVVTFVTLNRIGSFRKVLLWYVMSRKWGSFCTHTSADQAAFYLPCLYDPRE